MAGAFDDPVATTLGSSVHSLQQRAAIDANGGDLQLVNIRAFIVFSISDADSSTFLIIGAAFCR
jgi:hypothetical protein